MKELTIEQKARRYDEALERAKELLEIGLKDTRDKRVVLSFFPELAESEDERIKEKVIATIHLYYGEPLEDEAKEMIAWLEKQSKTSKVEETMREIEEKAKAFTEAHKGETTEEILAQMKGELMPTWSEEDERDFGIIYGIIYNSCNAEDASMLIEWLKSLKDRYTWKPSEEQLNGLKEAIEFLGCTKTRREQLQSLYVQLKKLREE